MFVYIHQGESSLGINSRMASREIGPILGFYGNFFPKPPDCEFLWLQNQSYLLLGQTTPQLKVPPNILFAILDHMMGPS